MVGALSVGGLVSGLDTEGIIQQLMAAERRPIRQLQARVGKVQARLSALQNLRTKLSTLQTKAFKLQMPSLIGGRAATVDTPSSNAAIVGATAGPDAALQTLALNVTQLATGTVASSNQGVGAVINSGAALADAGFGTTVNSGSSPTSFTITSVNTTTGAQNTQSFSVTTTTTLNDVIAAIDAQFGAGTATLTAGTDGRANNRLKLTTSAADIQLRLGAADDTSNFLTAAKLINAVPVTGASSQETESIGNLGTLRPTENLGGTSARLDGGWLSGTGSFDINGVSIAWDASADSLNDVINRINASNARVNAVYDTINDKFEISAKDTGNNPITLADTTGTFLSQLKVVVPGVNTQTLGQSAQFTINGTAYETQSNKVTSIVPSVTLDLKNTGAANVTITQDVAGALEAVKEFITTYNDIVAELATQTKYDPDSRIAGVLAGDLSARFVTNSLRSIISGAMETQTPHSNYSNLASVGISTGRIGSGVGTSSQLQFDETKFATAIADNPTAVGNLFAGFSGSASLLGGGTGSLASASGSPSTERRVGRYEITSGGSGSLSAIFTPSGGAPGTARTASIAASGTNLTLIPGVTLTAGALSAGINYVDITILERGLFVNVNEVLRDYTSATGSLASRQEAGDLEISRIQDQIQRYEDRLLIKEENLNRKFAAIERAMAQLQSQGSQLSASFAALNGTT